MNDNNASGSKAAVGLGVGFSMAAVWFATHCGGGFATGNQEVNFYVKYGWVSVFLPIIAMLLLGWSHRNALVIAKDNHTYDYKSYANALFHPYEKFFSIIFEFGFLMLIVCGVSASIAGAGALLSKAIGLPYGIGIVLVGIVLLLLTTYGGDLIIVVLKFKTYFLIVALALLTYLGLKTGAVNFHHIWAAKETFNTSIGEAVWKMLIYIGFQSFTVLPIVSVSHHIKSTKECNQFMVMGTILNGAFLVAVCIMLLGFSPEVLKETLPVYFVTSKLHISWLQILYSVLLFIALLGTAISLIFSSVARFENVWTEGKGIFASLRARRIAISFITMAICTAISVFGLTNIVVKGYGSVGYVGLFFVLIPQIVIGTFKIKKAAADRAAQGIVEE